MASRFGKRRALPEARHASTLVASGARIDISDRKQIASYSRRISRNYWQEAAWVYNKSIPILGFCHDYVRDSLARVRPLPAIMSDDPDAPPIPLTKDTAPKGLDPDLCDQILQRLAPFPEYMGQVAHKLDICGEAYVALLPDDDEPDGERCRVFSSRELITDTTGWSQRESPDDTAGTPLPPDAPLFRIWTPDPEWYLEPYSHMVRLNLPAEQLLLLSRLIKAIALSRMATTGKIIGIAEEFSLESAAGDGRSSTEDAGDGEAQTDPFIEDFMLAAEAAILNPESAAGVLPLILRGPKDLIKDGIVVHDVSRAVEDVLIKLRQEAREEIANGVNLPREIPLGIGDTNHWNAEEIRTQAWQVHLEPRALAIVTATTTAFFRPQLIANKVDPDIARRCVVWYDPSWFLGAPDLSESADFGFENHLIGAESWRRAKGYAEDDKQEEDEVEYWVGVKQRERITIRETGVAQGNDVLPLTEPGTTPKNAPPPPQQGDTVPVPDTPDKTAPKTPLTAAAAPRNEPLDLLGQRLVGIERDLRTKLHAVTEATVTRALESAGLKARNAIKNKATNASRAAKDQHRQLLAQIDAVPADKIIVSLGQTTLASYGLDHETLLAGALGTLEPKYRKLVARAQQAAAQQAAAAAGRDVDDDDVDQATDDARAAGWLALAGGVLALARNLMFNPAPAAPAVGEFDADTVVPMGLVRTALDIAGGAQPAAGTDATGGLGATTGPTMLDLFKQQLGIIDDQYEWDYGDAVRRTFEPHLDLDGVTFTTFEDDVLANGDDWPPVDFYAPNDHEGCLCAVVVTFTQADVGEDGLAAAFNPDQPRDEHGRFAPGDGGRPKGEGRGGQETIRAPATIPPASEPAARGEAIGKIMAAEVAAGHDTQSTYDKLDGAPGAYQPDRQAVHDEIVNNLLQQAIQAGAQQGDTTVILSGLPGAGKTESFDRVVNPNAVVAVSPDTMKEELAARGLTDAPPGVGAMEAAPLAHEESSDMAKQLAAQATAQGYNVVWDITGSSVGSITSRIDDARAAGRQVVGVFVDAPISKALDNAAGRYERGLGRDVNTARYTPPGNITSMADPSGKYDSLNRANFEATKSAMDSWVRVDNAGSSPKVAASSAGALGRDGKVAL